MSLWKTLEKKLQCNCLFICHAPPFLVCIGILYQTNLVQYWPCFHFPNIKALYLLYFCFLLTVELNCWYSIIMEIQNSKENNMEKTLWSFTEYGTVVRFKSAQGTRPRIKFLHFHAVCGGNWLNNRFAPLLEWAPILGILDPPLVGIKKMTFYILKIIYIYQLIHSIFT